MTIKIKILKENKQINEAIDPGMIMAIATALGVSVPIVRSMLDPRSKAEKDLDNARSYIDSKIKKANKGSEKRKKEAESRKKGYNDKLAALKKERGLEESLLKESIAMDILNFVSQHPVLTLAGAGITAAMMNSLLTKMERYLADATGNLSFSDVQREMKKFNIPSAEQIRMEKEIKKLKYQKELERRKKERGISDQSSPQPDPTPSSSPRIPMKDQESSETGISIPVPDEDLKTYVDIMNRVSRGEGTASNPKLQKLINKYGKENLERAAEGMLYEMFKRFI